MPTVPNILTKQEIVDFESPAGFTNIQRSNLFELTPDAQQYFNGLKSNYSKLSFILQYGYFRHKGRFFKPEKYAVIDIKYIIETYNLLPLRKCLRELKVKRFKEKLGGANATRHREEILRLIGWSEMTQYQKITLENYAEWMAKKQTGRIDLLFSIVDYCWQRHWVIPSYYELAKMVSAAYNQIEEKLEKLVEAVFSESDYQELMGLFDITKKGRSVLKDLIRIEQSTRPKAIYRNMKSHRQIKDLFVKYRNVIDALDLNEEAVKYYAGIVNKASTKQLREKQRRSTICLYLLAFIKDQFYLFQDYAMLGFLKSIESLNNKAKKYALERFYEDRNLYAAGVKEVLGDREEMLSMATEILATVEDSNLEDRRKLDIIRNMVVNVLDAQTDEFESKIEALKKDTEKQLNNELYYEAVNQLAANFVRAWRGTIALFEFDSRYSKQPFLDYIKDFQNGVESDVLTLFDKKERQALENPEYGQSLYQFIVLWSMKKNMKSGALNLVCSYDYRALETYMISDADWGEDTRIKTLEAASLLDLLDPKKHLDYKKEKLRNKYFDVNEKISEGKNEFIYKKDGRYRVKTPAIENNSNKFISTQISEQGSISILQILRDIEQTTPYIKHFQHHTKSNVALDANPDTAFAGIIALGCNIGVSRMAEHSLGITESELTDMVNWRFSNDNLKKINRLLIERLDELDLAKVYRVENDKIYSSSDGQKITVAVDSLISSYSYKYYGKDKGVTLYSFVDERQGLFHTTVYSAADREATYLIDGLLNNVSNLKQVHCSDTHGYTGAVFGVSDLLDISFAPRLKRFETQVKSCFSDKNYYERRGFHLKPTDKISRSLIESNWDGILRFMATIKLGKSSASQLFKRLNSYSIDHPLYKALKEYGKIAKSLHILTYYDDVAFRQKIQKQLNLVEASNRFFKAVFWDRDHKFHVSTKKELEQHALCRSIIQNSIILWNYMLLTEKMLDTKDITERNLMKEEIAKGSVLSWKHVMFAGQYDFTKKARSGKRFNLRHLNTLKVA